MLTDNKTDNLLSGYIRIIREHPYEVPHISSKLNWGSLEISPFD